MMKETPQLRWIPDADFKAQSNLERYRSWLAQSRGLDFSDYRSLWSWSVTDPAAFWESIWTYYGVKAYAPYQSVLQGTKMPFFEWFQGAQLNYAEHLFLRAQREHPAMLFQREGSEVQAISWSELARKTASLAAFFKTQGIGVGDCIAAYLANTPEATVAFLATAACGAVWSCCSPDFGADSARARFEQIKPKALIAVAGYPYGGKAFDCREKVKALARALPSVRCVVWVPYRDAEADCEAEPKGYTLPSIFSAHTAPLRFTPLPFAHPLWVLYSSGTTGKPKAITHSHGGVLLEHLKYLHLHNDVKPGERFFWFTTTGWMMWNFLQASMLAGATPVLYDGHPLYPTKDALWDLAEKAKVTHFGTSASYLKTHMSSGAEPGANFDLSALRSLSTTGSPLPPEAFDYVYSKVKKDLWLVSMSGGTDVCTAFVGGNPTLPVYAGEIQCRALGCALQAFDEAGEPLIGEVGEMVIGQPMPSMPIYFWGDPTAARYQQAYLETYPGFWRHGDWVVVTPRDSVVILGRSDATLNRHGVRIGTAEVYRAVDRIPEVQDSLIVHIEQPDGGSYMPLFVSMREGGVLDEAIKKRIRAGLKAAYSPRHVPDAIIPVEEIPYTISGKKMELPVKKLLMGVAPADAYKRGTVRNPEAMDFFVRFARSIDSQA